MIVAEHRNIIAAYPLAKMSVKNKVLTQVDYVLGDSLASVNGQNFTTRDYDHDTWVPDNCAVRFHAAWWYADCHSSNLNGNYHNGTHVSYADGVNWRTYKGYHESMKTTEMKFRAQI